MSVFLAAQGASAAAVEAALKAEALQVLLLLELRFASGTLYVSSANVPFTDPQWSYVWTGLGDMIAIDQIEGGPNDLAPLVEYSLGVPYELLGDGEAGVDGKGRIPALIGVPGEYANRKAILWGQILSLTATDSNGRPSPIGVPWYIHGGRMDRPRASFTERVVLTLPVEGALSRFGAPVFGMLTHRDQKRRFATDEGMAFAAEVTQREVKWTDW